MRISALILAFSASALLSAACAQTPSPVALVYVTGNSSSSPTGGGIYGFAASSAGKLTPVSGSPFSSPAGAIAANGKWLFGISQPNESVYNVESLSISKLGKLKLVDSATIAYSDADQAGGLFLDHTGSTLYADLYNNASVAYQELGIDQQNGKLKVDGTSDETIANFGLIFTGNNDFGYVVSCYQNFPSIDGYQRLSNGSLSELGISPKMPGGTPPTPNGFICPNGIVADPYNNLIVSMQFLDYSDPRLFIADYLAVYTADKFGNLTTTSTYQNMEKAKVDGVTMGLSPTGVYLANASYSRNGTAGTGLQLFYTHKAKPLTALTGVLLPGVPIIQVSWDKNEHLYALGQGKLYVFEVSSSGAKQVTGSPYTVPGGSDMVVLPR